MADEATLKIPCPSCKCPDQHVGMQCGFCGTRIPEAAGVEDDGTARVEEIIGFRGWDVEYIDGVARLTSPTIRDVTWEPGRWMIAECRGRHGLYAPDHPEYHGPDTDDRSRWAPVKGCNYPGHGCGYYAARTREHLVGTLGQYVRYTAENPTVIGRVQMQGKIIPATNGWRAQMCRPRTIYVPHELWKVGRDLRDQYGPHGVEVKMETTLLLPKDEVRHCQKCHVKLAARTPQCGFCGHMNT